MKKYFVLVAMMAMTIGASFANVQDPEKNPVEQTADQSAESQDEGQGAEQSQEEAPAEKSEAAE